MACIAIPFDDNTELEKIGWAEEIMEEAPAWNQISIHIRLRTRDKGLCLIMSKITSLVGGFIRYDWLQG